MSDELWAALIGLGGIALGAFSSYFAVTHRYHLEAKESRINRLAEARMDYLKTVRSILSGISGSMSSLSGIWYILERMDADGVPDDDPRRQPHMDQMARAKSDLVSNMPILFDNIAQITDECLKDMINNLVGDFPGEQTSVPEYAAIFQNLQPQYIAINQRIEGLLVGDDPR